MGGLLTHPEELEAFKLLSRDYGYKFHFTDKSDFWGREACRKRKRHDR